MEGPQGQKAGPALQLTSSSRAGGTDGTQFGVSAMTNALGHCRTHRKEAVNKSSATGGKAAFAEFAFLHSFKAGACATPTFESSLTTGSAALAFEALRLFELFQIDTCIDQKWKGRRARRRALRYN
jgi:hypothetical protein